MSNSKKKSVPLDIAAVAAALGVTSSAPAPTPKKAVAVAPKAANIQVKLCTGSVVTCVPKFMPTDVYVQTFDKVREVPVFRGKHVGFAAISDGTDFSINFKSVFALVIQLCNVVVCFLPEIVAFVDRNDGKYEELPESLTDNLYKQFTLKKVILKFSHLRPLYGLRIHVSLILCVIGRFWIARIRCCATAFRFL
jgi:hypothetical protein